MLGSIRPTEADAARTLGSIRLGFRAASARPKRMLPGRRAASARPNGSIRLPKRQHPLRSGGCCPGCWPREADAARLPGSIRFGFIWTSWSEIAVLTSPQNARTHDAHCAPTRPRRLRPCTLSPCLVTVPLLLLAGRSAARLPVDSSRL